MRLKNGAKSTITKSNTSKLIKQKMLNDYKYAIGTAKQAGDYNKIRFSIANAIENQEPFNFKSSAPNLKILTIVETEDTSPEEKLEIKCENNQ